MDFTLAGKPERPSRSGDFGNANQSVLNYILSNTELQDKVSGWTTLPKGSTSGASYGGFIGYNWQWNDVVMGAELNYNHMTLKNGAQIRSVRLSFPARTCRTVPRSITLLRWHRRHPSRSTTS